MVQYLGAPQGVLVPDEPRFPSTGQYAAGVACPYTGTIDQVENGQIGVVLGDVSQPAKGI